jgi:hypothetical protein
MFPLWQWDEFHPKAWSWLKGKSPQRYVQFDMESDLVRMKTKLKQMWESTHRIFWVKEALEAFEKHPKRTIYR